MRVLRAVAVALTALLIAVPTAQAQDNLLSRLMFDPESSAGFEGFYVGFQDGGYHNPYYNYFNNYGNGWHPSRFIAHGFAGVNYPFGDILLTGWEVQGGANYNTSGDESWDAWVLGRIGATPNERLMVYSAGGLGVLEGVFSWKAGGGVEWLAFNNIGARVELFAAGELGPNDNTNPPSRKGLTAIEAAFGVVWHPDWM